MSDVQPDANARFNALLDGLKELHAAKGADYGDRQESYSNMRRSARFGISPYLGCLLRLSDKWERIVQLSRRPAQVTDESVTDTLRDIATYAIIGLILYEDEHNGRRT